MSIEEAMSTNDSSYFQKMGLNAMDAAHTVGVSANHMLNAEKVYYRARTTYKPTTEQRNRQNRSGWPWCKIREVREKQKEEQKRGIGREELVDRAA